MDLPAPLGLSLVVVLVLANGFFVATEFAIVAVRRSRLAELAAEHRPGARRAQQVVEHLDTYIAACQFGITIASLGLGWIGEPALAHLIEPPLTYVFGRLGPAAAHGVAIGIAFGIITALHIVTGELAPKGLALQRPEGVVLWVARPMQIFYGLFRWPIQALNAVGNGVLRLAGLEPATGREMVHSVEELRLLVTGSQQAGMVEASEARIASRAFQFADLSAEALMTPRTEVEAVPLSVTRSELFLRVSATTHSRLPVYETSLDHIVGLLHVRDLFRYVDGPAPFDLRALLRPVLTIPASKPADDLLDDLRAARQQLAVVVDEYGGTAGIITLEDLMEGLVGRIDAEAPLGRVALPPAGQPDADGSVSLDGLTRLHEFEELTGLSLDRTAHDTADTLGGLIMASLGRIAEVGDHAVIAGRTLRVEQLHGRRVATVRLLPTSPPPPSSPASP